MQIIYSTLCLLGKLFVQMRQMSLGSQAILCALWIVALVEPPDQMSSFGTIPCDCVAYFTASSLQII